MNNKLPHSKSEMRRLQHMKVERTCPTCDQPMKGPFPGEVEIIEFKDGISKFQVLQGGEVRLDSELIVTLAVGTYTFNRKTREVTAC